ncbi:MAG: hypothetical protein EOP84_01765 [Verrucomicrobiaceae bacterium]|nr:MAG: hypothetical protein EOP84_01765 [Verrucomicrobiaceae bacterium]
MKSEQSRKTTVAIVEKASGEVLCYDELQGDAPPFELTSRYFDAFVKRVIADMAKGAERTFLFYSRTEGLRPDVAEVRVVNRTMRAERRIMGYRGPGAIEIIPYQVETVSRALVKKSEFPKSPGADASLTTNDDDGVDEEAIQFTCRKVYAILQTALKENFNEVSRRELLTAMSELLRSTGAKGDYEPREDWDREGSPDQYAMDVYDCAVFLWLESKSTVALPKHIVEGHRQRVEEDPKRAEQISDIARMIKRGGFEK